MTDRLPAAPRRSVIRGLLSSLGRLVGGPMSATRFAVIVAAANTVLYHRPLYAWAAADLDLTAFTSALALVSLLVVMFLLNASVLFLLFGLAHRIVKPICMVIALGNSIALYFIETYRVILDMTMMSNVRTTDVAEVWELLHPKLLLYVLLFGVLPIVWLARVRVQRVARSRMILQAAAMVVLVVAWSYLASGAWLWIDKNSKRLGGMSLPWSYAVGMARAQAAAMATREQVLLPPATFGSDEKKVVVLVIGEAARAENFSLYGYARATNPRLTAAGVVALKNTESCATYTTASLRCMLSPTAASPFSAQSEPLPSYLQRHGVDVIWRSNNFGEPRLEVATYEKAKTLRQGCVGAGCTFDEVLLTGLAERIAASKQRRVFVVLHTKGSHGPSYHERYPPQFEQFKPTCRSVELHECTNDELVNVYDNTILYTDYFLGQVIGMLDGLEGTPGLLIYISDHGESLGEFGLYLHGVPRSIAPDVQKKVPFIVWVSKWASAKDRALVSRLDQRDNHSDRNVFHSIMGAFDMRGEVYEAEFDIFNLEPE